LRSKTAAGLSVSRGIQISISAGRGNLRTVPTANCTGAWRSNRQDRAINLRSPVHLRFLAPRSEQDLAASTACEVIHRSHSARRNAPPAARFCLAVLLYVIEELRREARSQQNGCTAGAARGIQATGRQAARDIRSHRRDGQPVLTSARSPTTRRPRPKNSPLYIELAEEVEAAKRQAVAISAP